MMNARVVDRWILCSALFLFAAVTVYGMRIGNPEIARFGEHQFELFSGAMLLLLNRELFGIKNGNGSNGVGSVEPVPTLVRPTDTPGVVIPAVRVPQPDPTNKI